MPPQAIPRDGVASRYKQQQTAPRGPFCLQDLMVQHNTLGPSKSANRMHLLIGLTRQEGSSYLQAR
jgi:hypothetical protein